MAWFTSLCQIVALAVAIFELRAIRRAVETERERVQAPSRFQQAVTELQDAVVGATLPRVTSDEDELAVEREQYETMGAQGGYQVTSHWIEQDERDAYLEDEVSRDA